MENQENVKLDMKAHTHTLTRNLAHGHNVSALVDRSWGREPVCMQSLHESVFLHG
jgi:hypothetical protein